MNYTETNKLIAEFMGGKINPNWQDDTTWTFNVAPYEDAGIHWTFPYMQYHSRWDWLMPVVEKIEGMGYKFQMCRRRVTIKTDTNEIELFDTKGHSKLDASYESVSKFINWYNSNLPTPSIA